MNQAGGSNLRIVVPVLAGIGNAVMTIPLVRALHRMQERVHLTVAARTGAIADCFRGLEEVAEVLVLGTGSLTAWRSHRRLAARRPDLFVLPFPSNRWQYSALAATSRAQRVVMHDYPVGALAAMRFLPRALKSATFVAAERGLHDVVQNLRLAEALGVEAASLAAVRPPVFPTADADDLVALEWVGGAEDFIVIQPGGGATVVGRAKRWPVRHFAQLCDALAGRGESLVIIEGPDERGVSQEVRQISSSRPRVLELRGPLSHSAALLRRARLFVGNDSGLAHVAAAVGTPAVTIFAAADPARVAPFGYEHLVVTPRAVDGIAWRPRLLYPMDAAGPRLRHDKVPWAEHIAMQDVLSAVDRAQELVARASVSSSGLEATGKPG